MKNILRYIWIFLAGFLCCAIFYAAVTVLTGRAGWHIGGEALILPLMGLLVYVGWIARESIEMDTEIASYKRGYHDGVRKAVHEMASLIPSE